jgi:hypothetical protein
VRPSVILLEKRPMSAEDDTQLHVLRVRIYIFVCDNFSQANSTKFEIALLA